MKIKLFFYFTVINLVLALGLSGCGYTTHSLIASKYKTIYITPFVNKVDVASEANIANQYRIYKPMIESGITQYVTNQYLSDGNIRPVKYGQADLILKGEVVEFRKDPLRYDSANEVSEYRINLVVNISLWDSDENKLIWQENNFTGDTTYFALGPESKTEDAAVVDALKDLSRRIVERTVEQW